MNLARTSKKYAANMASGVVFAMLGTLTLPTAARGTDASSGSGIAAARQFFATTFRAGGKDLPLLVDPNHVAVRRPVPAVNARPNFLNAREDAAFSTLGLTLVSPEGVRGGESIVGVPVWFDRETDAVGVMTNEILVRAVDARAVKAVVAAKGLLNLMETTFAPGLYRARFSSPTSALAAANALVGQSGIRYAHPNFLVPKDFRATPPNLEPFFNAQWHLENTGQLGGTPGADIKAKAAWAVTTGAPETLIAVLDGGFELTHPDLDGAWFHNAKEIPGNGADDDGNGYVDDVIGWNFWSKSADASTGILVDHGTAVAGLVGARANGKGLTGVCPDCTVLPVVAACDAASDAEAFYYAEKMGAAIITNSWGYAVGTPTTDAVVEAINTVAKRGRNGKGTIILFAMNNIDQDDCVGAKPDISSLASVVAVSAASDQNKKVSFSAWGNCMEFLSPSYEANRPGIATTDLTGNRGYNTGNYPGDLADLDYTNDFGGTSAATPIAAGVFGLMLSVNPELTRDEALTIVEGTAEKIAPELANYDPRTGFSQKYGYGRIDAGRAVRAAAAFRKFSRRERPSTGATTKTY